MRAYFSNSNPYNVLLGASTLKILSSPVTVAAYGRVQNIQIRPEVLIKNI